MIFFEEEFLVLSASGITRLSSYDAPFRTVRYFGSYRSIVRSQAVSWVSFSLQWLDARRHHGMYGRGLCGLALVSVLDENRVGCVNDLHDHPFYRGRTS